MNSLARTALVVVAATAVLGCDMILPRSGGVAADSTVVADSIRAESLATAAAAPARRPPRRPRRTSTPPAASPSDSARADSAAADTAPPPPPPPTAAERAQGTMASDLRRLATAQAEHFANHGRFATQFSRLGIRYIPHAGVNVRITHAGVTGWAARATHADFEGVECVIEVGDPTGSGAVPVPPGSGGEPSCRP